MLATALGRSVGHVSHHVGGLNEARALRDAGRVARRGVVEHPNVFTATGRRELGGAMAYLGSRNSTAETG